MLSSLGFTFAVEGIEQVNDFDTRLNLKKRLYHFGCRGAALWQRINISYLSLGDKADLSRVLLADRSYSILENRDKEDTGYVIFTGAFFETRTPSFLVTNVFATQSATQTNIPLFYGHTLKNFNPTNDDWTSRSLVDVKFADVSLTPRDISLYYVNTSSGILYNSLRNLYQSGVLDVYYVIYSVKITSGSTSYIQTYHEILNNKPAFRVATYLDLSTSGGLSSSAYAYLIDDSPVGDKYTITLPVNDTWAYTEDTEQTRLSVRLPSKTSRKAPWFPRVAKGEFITDFDIEGLTTCYKYKIAEFDSQVFVPYAPYKYYTEEEGVKIADTLIKFKRPVVCVDNFPVEVILRDTSDEILAVYTTDSSKIGTAYNSSIDYEDRILSIDEFHGFVELEQKLASTVSKIEGTFYSECDEYELTLLDLNPLNNLDILASRAVIYVAPSTVYTGSLENSLFYLLVDESGRITYCSQAATDDSGSAATTKLLNEDFYFDGTPKHDFFYDIVSTSGLEWRSTGATSVYQDDFSFVDKYSTETQYGATLSGLTPLSLLNYQENSKFFILGDLYVGQQAGLSDLERIDIRQRGGGIRLEDEETALLEQDEILHYWDVAPRRFFPGGFSFYVEFPKSLVESGDFSEEQVRDVLYNHVQLGGCVVARSYGDRTPVILSGVVTSGSVAVGWPSYGSDAAYDIYLSRALDKGYEAIFSSLADDASGNSCVIPGLIPGTKYYIYIQTTTPTEEIKGLPVAFSTIGSDTSLVGVYDYDGVYDVSIYG